MTWLSRTLSWMPHCWPQKQQCVLTRRSGSSAVVPRVPTDRCGPNARVISRSSTGSRAMSLHLRPGRRRPERALGQAKGRSPARGTDLLVVLDAAPARLVPEPEVPLDRDEVADHRRRRVVAAAAAAGRLRRALAG